MMRLLRHVALMLALLLAGKTAAADTDTILLLTQRDNGDHAQLADAFMQRIATAGASRPSVRQLDVDALGAGTLPDGAQRPGLIVAVGSRAAQRAQAVAHDTPVLHVLIPRLRYEELYPADTTHTERRLHTALYIDQPFKRQLNLCRLIVPDLRHLAVLYGPTSQDSDRDLRSAAQQSGISLITQHVTAGTNPNAALDQVLDDSQLLLALPDPDVFTRYTVAGLLLTAYHHAVPIIGFSAAYVKAGALAAVYSTPEQIGRDAAEMALAARTDAGWALPAPRYPAYYNVAVNRQVGRSLSLKLPDDTDLQQALAHQEQAQQ